MIVIIKKQDTYSINSWGDNAGSYSTQGPKFVS